MITLSIRLFTFITIRPSGSAASCRISRSSPARRFMGATRSRLYLRWRL